MQRSGLKPAFSGTIEPTPVPLAYRLGLAVVALTMLLLPILYLGLIGATGVGVWWHLTENTWIMSGPGRSNQWRVIAYVAPAIAGLVLTFFMVKPILARPSRRQDPLPVDRIAEPALFALIDEICRQVRAPRPRVVQVDCTVNASAGFVHGPLMLQRRDLVLTIGLPLAAGLSIRELAGVLAHEFGHFAQGGGMRLTGIVRGVNGWFARVVYERDEWDEMLQRWSKEIDWRLGIVLGMARGAVWVSRKVLNGLMLGGHAISCFMMRQMEYDADSYEIKIAGTEAFKRTSMRLRELNLVARFAYNDLRQSLEAGTLPQSLPTFMVERGRSIPADVLARVRGGDDEKTGVFDTHPCDADRIRAAEAAGATGVLTGADADGGATLLFRDFERLSAAATQHHFEHDLGLDLGALTLVDTSVALRQSHSRDEDYTALEGFFGIHWTVYRPLRLEIADPDALNPLDLFARLADAREAMTRQEPAIGDQYAEFDALESKLQNAVAASELLAAGFPSVDAEDFDLEAGTAAAAGAALARATRRQQSLHPPLSGFEAAAAERLSCSLMLRSLGQSDSTGDDAGALAAALNALAAAIPEARLLRRLDLAARLVEANASSSPKPEDFAAHLRQLERKVVACRENVRGPLATVDCPPGFAASPMTLAERCGVPSGGPFVPASEIVDRVFKLYADVLGRLVGLASKVEESLAASA